MWRAIRRIWVFLIMYFVMEWIIGFCFFYLTVGVSQYVSVPMLLFASIIGILVAAIPVTLESILLPAKNATVDTFRSPLTKLFLKLNLTLRYSFARAIQLCREEDEYYRRIRVESKELKPQETSREQKEQTERRSDNLTSTVIGLMMIRKEKQTFLAYIFLIASLLVYIALSQLLNLSVRTDLTLLVLGLLLALFVNQKVLEYRIKKGFYGTNEFEAREVLKFILEHADKSSFSDGQGLKDIMPTPEPNDMSEEKFVDGTKGVKA